ncbi:MAG: hypothetical protein ACREDN_01290 [Aestuariivirga sp.]
MHRFEWKLRIGVFVAALMFFLGDANADSLNLYWINGFGSWFGYAPVEVDGRKAGTIKAGKQLRIAVSPGAHEVRIHIPLSFESAKLTVNVAGEQYLKVTRDLDGFFFNAVGPVPTFRLNLNPVTQEQAFAETAKKRLPEATTAELGPVEAKPKKKTLQKEQVSR